MVDAGWVVKPTMQRTLDALHRSEWVCGQYLAHPEVGGNRFSARLADLKGELGIEWEKRRCENPRHRHVTAMYEYRLKESSVQLVLEVAS